MTRDKVQTEQDFYRRAGGTALVWLLLCGAASSVSMALAYVLLAVGVVLGVRALWKAS